MTAAPPPDDSANQASSRVPPHAAPSTSTGPVTSAEVTAGLVTALVGFTSSFTVVLAGLRAAGASAGQATSGLLALSLGMGVLGIALSLRYRIPISIVWSTPGAALLGASGHLSGGFGTAVAAFIVCGGLLLGSGLISGLRQLVERIPPSLANALLAGVLLELCLAPVQSVIHHPGLAWPVVGTWAMLYRLARRWAVPAALVVAIGAILISAHQHHAHFGSFSPQVQLTAPRWSFAAISLGISLYVVTMASQNLPGVTVLTSFGFPAPLAPVLRVTGAATALLAATGAAPTNLAAISAALCVGPDAGPDPRRRWRAAAIAGGSYIVLGLLAGLLSSLVVAAPSGLVETVAGLALLGTLGNALSTAVADVTRREAAVLTFLVSASGISVLRIGAPFWGLLAGLAMLGLLQFGRADRAQK